MNIVTIMVICHFPFYPNHTFEHFIKSVLNQRGSSWTQNVLFSLIVSAIPSNFNIIKKKYCSYAHLCIIRPTLVRIFFLRQSVLSGSMTFSHWYQEVLCANIFVCSSQTVQTLGGMF